MAKGDKKHGDDPKRIIFLIISALLIWVILIIRIIQIQLIDRGKYVGKARDQYRLEMEISSNRGYIYDRNSNYLAINKPVLSLGVDISKINDHGYASAHFAEILGGNKNYYLRKLTNGSSFIWLKRGIEENIVNQLEALKLPGLRVIREMNRYYPQNQLAAHLVGFTDIDLKGLSGVELAKDLSLTGNPGRAFYQKDALGKTFTDITIPTKEPESGKNIALTIDNSFQLFAEEELKYTINQYNADGGVVIVTNPFTGEVLAMAVNPTFNPNNAGKYPPGAWRNRSITDCFEPGSTFKPFFMSAVLEEEIKQPDDIVFCENGKYKIYDNEIEDVGSYGWLTLRKIIAKSSNIGMSKLAQEIKKDLIYQYIRDFGFGVKTGIELNGEVAGELKNTIEWSRYTPLALSRGYEISVTALQLAMAYGAIANGGVLMKPILYLNEFDHTKNGRDVIVPQKIRRVISKNTSQILISMLEEVVQHGTGENAAVPGLRIAGKTGTARKYNVKRKAYSTNEFMASFLGFFPVDNPQILIYVMIDNPKNEYFGGVVAANAFKRILQRILRVIEIDSDIFTAKSAQNNNDDESNIKVILPDFISKKVDVGKKIIEALGLDFDCTNDGDLIVKQNPAPGTKVEQNTTVTFTLSNNNNNGKYTSVPKVVGFTIRDAVNHLSLKNLNVYIEGSGRVVKQVPAAGEKIRTGARCVIECEPIVDLSEFKSW